MNTPQHFSGIQCKVYMDYTGYMFYAFRVRVSIFDRRRAKIQEAIVHISLTVSPCLRVCVSVAHVYPHIALRRQLLRAGAPHKRQQNNIYCVRETLLHIEAHI